MEVDNVEMLLCSYYGVFIGRLFGVIQFYTIQHTYLLILHSISC
jgi:hypothetical protein